MFPVLVRSSLGILVEGFVGVLEVTRSLFPVLRTGQLGDCSFFLFSVTSVQSSIVSVCLRISEQLIAFVQSFSLKKSEHTVIQD